MKYSPDILEQIERILSPIENTLEIMLAHKNVKAESKTQILQNIHALEAFRAAFNPIQASNINRSASK